MAGTINPWVQKAFGKLTNKRTNLEQLMARALDDHNVMFREQVHIGPYRVDFLIIPHIVVEVDGDYWHKSRKAKDAAKDRYLRACGYEVWRWDEWSVRSNAGRCVKTMLSGPK